jgi:hypothetical protein
MPSAAATEQQPALTPTNRITLYKDACNVINGLNYYEEKTDKNNK